ncbi:hypothetical protein WDZ92_54575, partial [Nostoc sp. NIES-2111]
PALGAPDGQVLDALSDDLNTAAAIARLHRIEDSAVRAATLAFLGFSATADEIARHDAKARGLETSVDTAKVDALIAERLAARKAKDFAASDRIRDELAAMGVQLKDGKDPATGEPVTTGEVKR